MNRYVLPLGIFVLVVIFLGIGLRLDPREVPSPLIGKPVPDFSLPKLHKPSHLFKPAELQGTVWILNVWASWCVSCRAEHKIITRLADAKEASVIGLNYKDMSDNAVQWLKHFGDPYEFSIVDKDGRVGIDWGVYGVPETFIIDKQGIIRHKHIGPVDDEALDTKILPLVRELKQEGV